MTAIEPCREVPEVLSEAVNGREKAAHRDGGNGHRMGPV